LSIPEEESNEEEDYNELKKFTNYLKKGYWNYFNSPVVVDMQERQAERKAIRSKNPKKWVYYPLHEPCFFNQTEDYSPKRSYSPKMYQNVFGDMTLDPRRMPQLSPSKQSTTITIQTPEQKHIGEDSLNKRQGRFESPLAARVQEIINVMQDIHLVLNQMK